MRCTYPLVTIMVMVIHFGTESWERDLGAPFLAELLDVPMHVAEIVLGAMPREEYSDIYSLMRTAWRALEMGGY